MRIEDEIKQKKFSDEFEKLGINILFTGSWLRLQNLKALKAYGLSPEQYNIMRILRGQYPEPSSVNLLIERMIDKTSNASRIVEKLRTKEFVERKTSPNDRRQVDVIITQKGLDLLKQIDTGPGLMVNVLKGLSQDEAGELNRLLDKLRNAEK